MRQFETIKLVRDERSVARLTLNRPGRHNALDALMIAELAEAAHVLGADSGIRAVVLAGEGKSFCAGADLAWMKQQFTAPPDEQKREAMALAEMLRAIDELPQFVIGVVAGAAYGGGVGLAAVCDLVIAGPAAQFALTETRLGLIPATIAPYVHRRIGAAAMRRLALHGERFGAAEAKSIGLVSRAAAEEEIDALVQHHIAQALACAPGAIADAKTLFRQLAAGPVSEAETAAALVHRWSTGEAKAGVAAFFAKEKAPWQS